MGTQDLPDLRRRLESHKPATVLAIGARAGELLAGYQSAHRDCRIEYLDADGTLDEAALLRELARQQRFDFVIVRGVLERIDADSGAHLLASLRDVHSRRLCVVLDGDNTGHRWKASELIAMGLSHWASETLDEATLDTYGFDLGTYKATPEWLNARHWAHPEHWGKYRW